MVWERSFASSGRDLSVFMFVGEGWKTISLQCVASLEATQIYITTARFLKNPNQLEIQQESQ